ncbi:hypothetical protein VBZ67_00985 [Campylobacter concisus]
MLSPKRSFSGFSRARPSKATGALARFSEAMKSSSLNVYPSSQPCVSRVINLGVSVLLSLLFVAVNAFEIRALIYSLKLPSPFSSRLSAWPLASFKFSEFI